MATPSLLDVLEACYRFDLDDAAWVEALADAARPVLDGGLGTAAFLYRRHPSEAEGRLQVAELALAPRADPEWLRSFLSELPAQHLDAWAGRPVGTVGPEPTFRSSRDRLRTFGGASHVVSLNGLDPTGDGVWLGAPLSRVTGRVPATFKRIAAHLAAAGRLRRRLRDSPSPAAEAVLHADGTLADAVGCAAERAARTALREATVQLDRTRTTAARSFPDETIGLRRALVSGRWSLVDRFENDGKHYVVATFNAIDVHPISTLSERERQVLALAALGHHNKLIAYEMGLSDSTVRVLLHRATAKLGVRSRAEAIASFRAATRSGERLRRE